MKISTESGKLKAMAWHIGRHVALTTENHHLRLDGPEVENVLNAVLDSCRYVHEHMKANMLDSSATLIFHDGKYLNFSSGEEIILTDAGVEQFVAVLQTAMRFPKGLDEMHEEEERKRYGLQGDDER